MTDDMIERVARAIYWAEIGAQKANKSKKAQYEAMARAAIAAMPIRDLVELLQTLIDNDPSEPISDAGHTVLDGWRARAKVVIKAMEHELLDTRLRNVLR